MTKARSPGSVFLDVPVPIRTGRLLLRPPTIGDGVQIAEAVTESHDALYPWFHEGMADRGNEASPVWQETVAIRFLSQFLLRERLPFYAFADSRLCAFVELRPDWRVGRHRLSYWVRSSMTGLGIGTEAVGAVTRYAFEALDARCVTVGHADGNVASASLIEKLGFDYIARQPFGYEMPDGTLVDGLSYAMHDPAPLLSMDVWWGDGRQHMV